MKETERGERGEGRVRYKLQAPLLTPVPHLHHIYLPYDSTSSNINLGQENLLQFPRILEPCSSLVFRKWSGWN